MKLRLIYFDIPFWRAEVSRLALFIGNIEFEDIRIKSDEFSYIKEMGTTHDGTEVPFRQLPVLDIDGVIVAQTGAIARYCGKLGGLYPTNNPIQAAKIDQIIDFATDINLLLGPSRTESDPNKREKLRKELAVDGFPKAFNYLEKLLENNNFEKWFVGENISIADIAIWRLMGWLTSGMIDHIPTDLLNSFPLLTKLCSDVNEHPKVNEWVVKTHPKK